MGKGLDGVAKENWTLCSPECTIHERDEYVSQRTRRRCDERIELENLKHATLQQTQTPQPSANQPEYPEPMSAELEAALSAFVDSLAAELEPPLPAQSDLAYEDDITMPTWGMPFGEGGFEYGGQDNAAGESDDDLPAAQSLEAGPESDSGADQLDLNPTYDIAAEWSTDVGYLSGTEADIDSDVESNAELDNLIPISPTLSPRPLTPEVIEMDLGGLEFHGTEAPPIPASPASPAPPDNSASGEPDPALNFDPTTPTTSTDLPDALRAYRELILKLATDGDLTVVAANAMLKTLNMCLDKDLLRCGPEANPARRLPATLETLKKQVSEPSDVMKIHVISRQAAYVHAAILDYAAYNVLAFCVSTS
ncbi:hypothetical protein FRC07_009656 [Ceratobasidium sp. 392]|nr:hypothetical protein FRC07_009656 [Ceratobasidium sp. 392]